MNLGVILNVGDAIQLRGSAVMQKLGYFKQLYFRYLAKPKSDRQIYQSMAEMDIKNVLEIGITSLERTCNSIQMAHRFCEDPIHYFGIDLFEAGGGQNSVGLKTAHVELKKTGAKIKLMPGDPFSCLSRSVNLIPKIDLLVIGGNCPSDSLSRSWFYLAGLMNPDATLYLEKNSSSGESTLQPMSVEGLQSLAEKSTRVMMPASSRRAA